jgi:hypothetical protein
VEACNLIHCLLPLGRSNFRVTRDQPQPGSFLNKREEPGNEVDLIIALSANITKRLSECISLTTKDFRGNVYEQVLKYALDCCLCFEFVT